VGKAYSAVGHLAYKEASSETGASAARLSLQDSSAFACGRDEGRDRLGFPAFVLQAGHARLPSAHPPTTAPESRVAGLLVAHPQ
jgi:hypothetical protein